MRHPFHQRDTSRLRRVGIPAVVAGALAAAAVGVALPAGEAQAHSVAILPPRTIHALIGSAMTVTLGSGPTTPEPDWAGPPATGITSPTGIWHTDVRTAPVAATSGAMITDLVAHVTDRYGGIAAFNAHQWPVSFVTAPAGTPLVDVGFWDCQGKGSVPAGLTGPGGQLTGLPLPADAIPAAGTDNELSLYSPSTDQLWELWRVQHTASGWSACWGGRIDHVSQGDGVFSGSFGASASGLAIAPGMVSVADARSGVIDHALTLAIPDVANWNDVSWPATRSDGNTTDQNAIPEGTRLRLDPSVDVDAIPGLTPLARAIAHAAQTYGFIVTDTSGAVAVSGQSGAMQQAATGTDPWTAALGGVPDYLILRNFPWSELQALPKDYGKP